jgi:hypothetical protein
MAAVYELTVERLLLLTNGQYRRTDAGFPVIGYIRRTSVRGKEVNLDFRQRMDPKKNSRRCSRARAEGLSRRRGKRREAQPIVRAQ